MKYSYALCLLLASSCCALVPKPKIDISHLMERQHKAMRSVLAANPQDDMVLINTCFNNYMTEQSDTITNYNKEYNGCVDTADDAKAKLTAQSADERESLVSRSADVCQSMSSCDTFTDGLEFFDCYRTATTDSYKVIFALNSDSNTDYNTISAAYTIIDNDLTNCIDDARFDYYKKMDTCDDHLQSCLKGDYVPETTTTTTEEPQTTTTTPEPEPEPPTTPEPETPEPETTTTAEPEPETTTTPEPETPEPETTTTAEPEPETTPTPEPETPEPETTTTAEPEPETTPTPEPETPEPEETTTPEPEPTPTETEPTTAQPNDPETTNEQELSPEEDLEKAMPKAFENIFKKFF